MRQAFTLIEMLIVVCIVVIVTTVVVSNVKAVSNSAPKVEPIKVKVGDATYTCTEFKIDVHEFYMIGNSQQHGFTAIHSPFCKACKQDTKVER